jgi:class 3 adenylate cyclase
VIGDAVNTASRLESEAPVGAVAIGAVTMRRLPEAAVRPLGELRVKGKLDAVEAFILVDA